MRIEFRHWFPLLPLLAGCVPFSEIAGENPSRDVQVGPGEESQTQSVAGRWKIEGCWTIRQTNVNGQVYTGTIRIARKGSALSGTIDWDNHEDGILTGKIHGRSVSWTQTFPGTPKEGLVGHYHAIVSRDGKSLERGKTWSGQGDAGVWEASSAVCSQPLTVSGCWSVSQSNSDGNQYHGTLQLVQRGDSLSGSMDWVNHADAVVTGRIDGARLSMSFVYPTRPGLVGAYIADFDPFQNRLARGVTVDQDGNMGNWSALRGTGCLPSGVAAAEGTESQSVPVADPMLAPIRSGSLGREQAGP